MCFRLLRVMVREGGGGGSIMWRLIAGEDLTVSSGEREEGVDLK